MEKNLYKNVMTVKEINVGDFLSILYKVLVARNVLRADATSEALYNYMFDDGGHYSFKDADYMTAYLESIVNSSACLEMNVQKNLIVLLPCLEHSVEITLGMRENTFRQFVDEIIHHLFIRKVKNPIEE